MCRCPYLYTVTWLEYFWSDSTPNTTRPISQYYVLFYECIWHGCKRNGIPLSAHLMYLNIVLRWPEDGCNIAETCRHIVNWKLCHFVINVVSVDGIIYQYPVTLLNTLKPTEFVPVCTGTLNTKSSPFCSLGVILKINDCYFLFFLNEAQGVLWGTTCFRIHEHNAD
jgi:hypothetical protein